MKKIEGMSSNISSTLVYVCSSVAFYQPVGWTDAEETAVNDKWRSVRKVVHRKDTQNDDTF